MCNEPIRRVKPCMIGFGGVWTLAIVVVVVIMPISCGVNERGNVFDSILDLYEKYDVVHLGERHWNMRDYNFRVSLIHYPRFAEVVDDIVIESGNYLYQDILDGYILELKDIPQSELQKVWRNTVVTTGVWDATIYKNFIHEVRKVNGDLPPENRIRLIAAEPPIDWSKISTFDEWWSYLSQRSTHTPEIIKSEVIDKGRKAFVVYGGAHFYRASKVVDVPGRLRGNLEALIGGRVFSILPLSGDDEYSKRFADMVDIDSHPLFVNLKISEYSDLRGDLFFEEAPGKLGEFTDGILYLGPGPELEAEYDPEAANDSIYQTELERRRAIESQWR